MNTNKPLSSRNTEGYYLPDDLDKIKESTSKASTNHEIIAEFLKHLKKTKSGEKIDLKDRLDLVQELLHKSQTEKSDSFINHFIRLTEKLFDCSETQRYLLLERLVELPLESASSYVQGTVNNDTYLRRKYYDGQVRKRKDGSTYQREINIVNEADTIRVGENGKEYSPMKMVETYDNYFNNTDELLAELNDEERKVAIWLSRLSTHKKKATIKELVEITGLTKSQVETIKMKLKFKALKWLKDNDLNDDYNHYYDLCKKYKNFNENYEKFIKNVKK